MKRNILLFVLLFWGSFAYGQTLPMPFLDWVRGYHHWKLNSEKIGVSTIGSYFIRTYEFKAKDGVGTEFWRDWAHWISGTKHMVGLYEMLNSVNTGENSFPLRFFDSFGNEIPNVYEKDWVLEGYRSKLNSVEGKRLLGAKMLYAELPRNAESDILLCIVLESEMKANKGIPTQKVPFGVLKFDRENNIFNFTSR